MNDYPKYAEVNGRIYNINTDFRVAIECNRIAEDDGIGELERSAGIICTLFGEKAVDNIDDWNDLLKIALKYLSCGQETKSNSNEKPDMDYIQDAGYIASSFQYDYQYNPYEEKNVHWWKFFNDLNNLSNSEFGNCCILNRVRNLRNMDLKDIKDTKEREKIIKTKKQVALKKDKKEISKEQREKAMKFYEQLGILERSD